MDIILSPDQQRAIESNSSAITVVAGAGSGKTEIVARRIERLLKESEDDGFRILAVSYTVKAAEQLQRRLESRLGDLHKRVDADTIHGFAWSQLRQHGSRIGLPSEPEVLNRDADRAELLWSWLEQSGYPWPDDPATVFADLDLARARGQDAPLLAEWRDALHGRGAVDYAAMLDRASDLAAGKWFSGHLKRLYGHVIIDEAQNLTFAQYRLITQIIGPPNDHLDTMMVGDERQSIIGFAGADRGLMKIFELTYDAERIELSRNYRSARRIIAAGRAVAESLHLPTPLNMEMEVEFPATGAVEIQALPTENAEAEFVSAYISQLLDAGIAPEYLASGENTRITPEDIAVLGRASTSLRLTREALENRGIATASASTEDEWLASILGQTLVEIIAFRSAPTHLSTRRRLSTLCGTEPMDDESLSDYLNRSSLPGVASLSRLAVADSPDIMLSMASSLRIDDADWQGDLALLESSWYTYCDRTIPSDRSFGGFRQHISRSQRGDSLSPGVRLLTVHKAQGHEFRVVIIVACNDGQFPDFRARTDEGYASELRTFYVAISRATRLLLLTRSVVRTTRYGSRRTDSSPFLNLISATA